MLKEILFLLILFVTSCGQLFSQRMAVSTDAINWLTLSPNVNAEIVVSNQTSVNLDVSCNPFNKISNNLSLKHIAISPEFRYWFKRPLYSHFVGANLLLSNFDTKFGDNTYIGQLVALGVGYGYSFVLSDRWNVIPNIGVGYGYIHSYDLSSSGMPTNIENKFKPMITRIGVSFSYIIN